MPETEKSQEINALLRNLPSMEELLASPWAIEFCAALGRAQVKNTIAQVCGELRRELIGGKIPQAPSHKIIADRASEALRAKNESTLKPVVNATGVIIHTNLGRAPLTEQAARAAAEIAAAYSTLEYSLEKGARHGRLSHIERLLCQITGAQAALVVNNNAAAVLLALCATAKGREVIVSAGELVEIGDSFRIPDILSFSGARMAIVGCTNATRIGDYERAVGGDTAVLLKVQPSNYRVEGFMQGVQRGQLAALAAQRGLVFIEDLGSGLLCDLERPLSKNEQSVRKSVEEGAHIVTFSADKLLGGPQIGVIAGQKHLVDQMKANQLYRALRVDKMTLAAFEATLRLYAAGRQKEIPVISMIEAGENELLEKSARLRRRLCRLLKKTVFSAQVVPAESVIGGGAFPTERLAGYGVSVSFQGRSAEELAAALRAAKTPVITTVKEGRVILHVRTLLAGDEEKIAAAFCEILI